MFDMSGFSHYELDELYSLYRRAAERTHEWIMSTTPPGGYREQLLRDYRAHPREHFEARLAALSQKPIRYRRYVGGLRALCS